MEPKIDEWGRGGEEGSVKGSPTGNDKEEEVEDCQYCLHHRISPGDE